KSRAAAASRLERRRPGQDDLEARAAFWPVRSGNVAAHLLDDSPADAQAEPGPLAARLGRNEADEHARQHILGYAGPVVVDDDAHEFAVRPLQRLGRNLDPAGAGVARVVYDVDQHLLQPGDVTDHRQAVDPGGRERDPILHQGVARQVDGAVHRLT